MIKGAPQDASQRILAESTKMKLLLAIALLNPTFQWTIQQSGVNARLRGVSAVSDRVAWASGAAGTVLRTADGGTTWQKLTVTTDAVDFRDIDAIDSEAAYVLSIGNGPASRIYKTTDAGATWAIQFKNDDARVFLDAMSFWDAEHGIVMGDSIDRQFFIMTTDNGGRTWMRLPVTALPPALENEGAFAASGSNIAVFGKTYAWVGTGAAAKARVLRTTDRGRTWKISETPLTSGPSAGIFSIAFRDATHGVIVGGDYKKEKERSDNLAVTSDGGATWTLAKGLSGYRSVVAYVPHAKTPTIVAIGPSGADYSIDDGRTWMVLDGPGFDTLSFVRDQGRLSAVGWAAGERGRIGRLVLGSSARITTRKSVPMRGTVRIRTRSVMKSVPMRGSAGSMARITTRSVMKSVPMRGSRSMVPITTTSSDEVGPALTRVHEAATRHSLFMLSRSNHKRKNY